MDLSSTYHEYSRQAINAPIQGTAADIIKRAMLRMEEALAKDGIRADMLLQARNLRP